MEKLTVPEFPDVPTANLARLSLAQLSRYNSAELRRVLDACITNGFFYLELNDEDISPHLSSIVSHIFGTADKLTDMPEEEKRRLKGIESPFGYKNRQKDPVQSMRAESFNMPTDYLTGLISKQDPPIFSTMKGEEQQVLADFAQYSRQITTLLIGLFEHLLDLPEQSMLSLHQPTDQSGSRISITATDPAPDSTVDLGFNPHTDHGTMTLVFHNGIGGLQVLTEVSSHSMATDTKFERHESSERVPATEWTYVRPLRNHVIVNMGDAIKMYSGEKLRSAIHRVVAPPGEQAKHRRYSIVYFTEPNYEARVTSLVERENGKTEDIAVEDKSQAIEQFDTFKDFWEFRMKTGPKAGIYGQRERELAMAQVGMTV